MIKKERDDARKKATLETHKLQYCQVRIASGKDNLWLRVRGNRKILGVRARNAGTGDTDSSDCRGRFNVRYDKTSLAERKTEVFNLQDNNFCQSGAVACKEGLVPWELIQELV